MAPRDERANRTTEPKAAEPVALAPAEAPPAGPAFTAPVPGAMVEVILPIEVDGTRFEPGDVTAIRAELVPALVTAGAASLWQAPVE